MKRGASLGSSWADEVEREEQEAEEDQKRRFESIELKSKPKNKKPNPFGDARPREVVLQEKGVDWRKLDMDLRPTNPNLRKDTELKEKISFAPSTIKHAPLQKNLHTSPLVPPLKHAPKNIMALMERIRRGRKDISHDATMDDSYLIPREFSEHRNHPNERRRMSFAYYYPCDLRNESVDLRETIRMKKFRK